MQIGPDWVLWKLSKKGNFHFQMHSWSLKKLLKYVYGEYAIPYVGNYDQVPNYLSLPPHTYSKCDCTPKILTGDYILIIYPFQCFFLTLLMNISSNTSCHDI